MAEAGTVQATLTDWLRERLEEDEAQLRPIADACDCAVEGMPFEHGALCPARMLAEVEAKSAIINEFESAEKWAARSDWPEDVRQACAARHLALLQALQLLALPYRDASGWNEAWRP